VRFVHDHRVAASGQRLHLVEHERELLQRRDDDPRLLAGERPGELIRVFLDQCDDAVDVLDRVDAVA
jgi:hypothetical protein